MPRKVKEWVGKTDDTMPPPSVRLRIFEKHGGRFRLTGKKILAGDRWDLDHIVPLADGGENRESNLAPVLHFAHQQKTVEENKARAKATGTRQMTTSDNKSLVGNIGWFWVFAGVTRKLFENGPFKNTYDAVADARSKITRDELIAFCEVTKDDAGKRNYLTAIRCEIVTASGYTTPIGLLPNQFDESYPLILACNIPDNVDEIRFLNGIQIEIIASRSLSGFFGMIRRQEDEREAIRKQLLAEMKEQFNDR